LIFWKFEKKYWISKISKKSKISKISEKITHRKFLMKTTAGLEITSPSLENPEKWKLNLSELLQTLRIDPTHEYYMTTKFEGDPTSLSGSTRVWELEIQDFRVFSPSLQVSNLLESLSPPTSKSRKMEVKLVRIASNSQNRFNSRVLHAYKV